MLTTKLKKKKNFLKYARIGTFKECIVYRLKQK